MKTPIYIILFALACFPQATLSAQTTVAATQVESERNLADLNAAIELCQSDKYAEAEKAFTILRNANLQKSTWGMVSNNLGIVLKIQKKYSQAIEVFKSVLDSDVNDRDPGSNLMEGFRNYRHKACIQIALCYEALGTYEKAIEYIHLAKEKYTFQADCGNCADDAAEALKQHEARIIEKQKKA
jgi:tetratricopeptide (TPR) repeat protein